MKKTIYFIITGLFLLVVILPLLTVIISSFTKNSNFSLENYVEIFQPKTLQLLLSSVTLAGIIAITTTIIGGVFAFFLTKTDLPFRNIFKLAFLIPLFLAPYILAVSWVDFFVLLGSGRSFIYSRAGVIFVLSIIFTPLSMLIISSGLSNINSRMEEAGLMITSYSKTAIKIILPLIKPSIITSFILVFVLAISEFSVPAFLAVNVFVTEIFTQFSAFYQYDIAIANAMVLITLCISLLMLEKFYLADAPFLTITPKSQQVRIIPLKKAKFPLLVIHILHLLLSVIIPVAMLVFQAFQTGWATLEEAGRLLLPTILDSIFYATGGAFLLVLFGFIFAWMAEREQLKALNSILLITFGVPSTVLGIGLIKFFNIPLLTGIYSSFWIVIIGYLGRFIFVAEKLIANALKQVPRSFEESAQLTGAGFLQQMRKIVLPLTFPGVFGAFLIGFLFCLNELGTTIMVYPPGTSLMPIKIFTIMANAPQRLTSAMSLIVLLITFSVLAVMIFGYKLFVKKT